MHDAKATPKAPTNNLMNGATGPWEIVVGLEVHAQVNSKSKLFSGSSTAFGADPNSHVSLVDAAMPGMLPVINAECVAQAIRTGLGLKAKIKWQRGGHWVRDRRGQVVEKDGDKQFIEGEWNEKTVDVSEYEGGDRTGRLRIHFFPNDVVTVTVLPYGPGHKDYPYPYPKDPKKK